MKQVIIMRGPSGSGKGTWLKENAWGAYVVSADKYFMKKLSEDDPVLLEDDQWMGTEVLGRGPIGPIIKDGDIHYEYVFNPSKIALAHSWCMSEFLSALKEERPLVAVDNTNTHLWEFKNYIRAAELAGYEVQVVAMRAITVDDIKLCAKRNLHRVPIEVVAKMAYEYEPYEGEATPSINRHAC